MQSQAMGPLPDSQLILTNQPLQRPQPLTTSTKAGKAAAITRKRKPATQKNEVGDAKKKSRATKKSANNLSEGAST